MDDGNAIVAIGLLTRLDLERLGAGFARAYPVEDADGFADVLAKLEAIEWPPSEKHLSVDAGSISRRSHGDAS